MYSLDYLYQLYCDRRLDELRKILEDEDLVDDVIDELFDDDRFGFIAFIYSI